MKFLAFQNESEGNTLFKRRVYFFKDTVLLAFANTLTTRTDVSVLVDPSAEACRTSDCWRGWYRALITLKLLDAPILIKQTRYFSGVLSGPKGLHTTSHKSQTSLARRG